MRALSEREAHLWWADPTELDPASHSGARALLDGDEIVRLERFHGDPERLLFLAARVLARTVLSKYAPVAPAEWRFETDQYGRPHVSGSGQPKLGFSISHTSGLVACAVAHNMDVGVDAERLRPRDVLPIAERFFAPHEVRALRALPTDAQLARFYDYWTLKESYVKARGRGLQIALDRVAFELERGRPPRVEIDPEVDDGSGSWRFVQHRPTDEHVVALCIRRRHPTGVTVVTRRQRLASPAHRTR